MKVQKIKWLTLLLLMNLFCLRIAAQDSVKIDWKADLLYLKNELPNLHSNLFHSISKPQFEKEIDDLMVRIPELSNQQAGIKIKQLFAKIGDIHTNLSVANVIDVNARMPFNLFWFKEGFFIIGAHPDYQNLIGNQIVGINNFPLKVVADSLATLYPNENLPLYKKTTEDFITYFAFLRYFNFVKGDSLLLNLISQNGTKNDQWVSPKSSEQQWKGSQFPTTPLYQKFCDSYYDEEYVKKDSLYFIQYNNCWSRELELMYGNATKAQSLPSFTEFENKVFNVLQSKPISKLVIDLRFNSGGASYQGTQFIERISRFREINQKGKIFVIVGRETFSSAIINVMDFKKLTAAIFVGEETSGKPNHYGEIKLGKLPSSGLKFTYSTSYFKYTDDNPITFEPDQIIEVTYENYKNGIDKALEWILKQ